MPQSFLKTFVLDRYDAGSPKPGRAHIVELDSLRGVAAIFVVLSHFLLLSTAFPYTHFALYVAYIPFLTAGGSAVIMFFVLSGFVLSLPMLSAKSQSYPAYVVRRVCRIYLPYVIALLLALAACWRFHRSLDVFLPASRDFWQSAPSWPLVARHLMFLGRYDVQMYNAPAWSLVHEMRISLIFPLLCLVALRLRPWAASLVALMFPVACRLIEKYTGQPSGDGTSSIDWSRTIGFCGIFIVGSLLARYRQPLVARLTALPAAARWLLPVVATGLYQYPAFLHVPRALREFAIGLGSAYFLILSLVPGGWLSRLLRLSPLRFAGRISYSLYLTHAPILIVMSIAIWGKMPYIYLLLPFLAVALASAALFYRFVEVPSIALGKAITVRWQKPETASVSPGRATEPVT